MPEDISTTDHKTKCSVHRQPTAELFTIYSMASSCVVAVVWSVIST